MSTGMQGAEEQENVEADFIAESFYCEYDMERFQAGFVEDLAGLCEYSLQSES